MTSYRYLGYGTTDSNGVAHYTYTGTGAGEVDVIASLDNPISEGSIVSETYSIQDLLAYDTGIDGTETNLYSVSGGLTKTVGSDGTLFSVSNGTSPTINFLDKRGTQYYLPTTPFEVNFDVVSQDVSLLVYYTDQDSHYGSISMNNGFSVGHTVKLKYNGSKIQIFYDDTASTSANVTFTSKARIYIIKAWGSGQSFNLKIKNFKAYPI